MNKKIIWGVVIIVILVWVFSIQKSTKVVNGETIKIGVSTILSGDWAALGQNIVNAAKLAVSKINAAGGINGRKLEILVEDAGVDSKTGLAAAQKLINIDKVKYIIGGTSSNGTLASAPLANQNMVIYMTPVTGGDNVDNAGEYVFRTANSDLLAGRDIANMMHKLGFKKVGVVAELTEYTLDLKKSFENTEAQLGDDVVISEEFEPKTTDFRTIIAKVKLAKPEAIFIASQTGIGGAIFVKQAKESGLKTTYFSDFTFVTNADAKKIIGSFDGIYFADPKYNQDDQATKDFFASYQSTYNVAPTIPFHAAATADDINLLAEAIRSVGDDSEKVHDWLISNVKDYHGLMGIYSLDSNGNSDIGFDIKLVQGNKNILIN